MAKATRREPSKDSAASKFTNLELARLLRKMAAAYTLLGENRFKIIAYDNAATAVEHATSEVVDLWQEGKLDSIPGLGPSICAHLAEFFKTGRSKHFDQILGKVNPAVFPLLEVPGIGPKKAEKLVKILHTKNPHTVISELEKAAKGNKVAHIEDFGEKSQQDILENIARHKRGAIKERRMVLPEADNLANQVIEYLSQKLGNKVKEIDKLGSLRRQVATIGDIDLAVASASDYFDEVIDAFINYPKKAGFIEKGPTGASILLSSGRQADLRVSSSDEYGAMLQYFTGSKYHNIRLRDYALKKGYSVNEYGIKKLESGKLQKFGSEESIYHFLGLDYIPPELREDNGEIDAAIHHSLPNLVELADIKGDLQLHSNFDQETSHDSGVNSIREIKEMGEKMGYEYVALTDHNPSSKHNAKDIVSKLAAQTKHIEQLNSSSRKTRVLSLLEVDILPDGKLPVPQEGLDHLDACLVSIHSGFNMSKDQMTKRVLAGLSNPKAKILAHPTGRLLGQRDSFELDWEKIFDFCKKFDKAVEINCYPNRLDLPDVLVREAVRHGVYLSLGTDSHTITDMVNMRYGVSVARRGWAEKKNIINTWEYNRLITWLRQKR